MGSGLTDIAPYRRDDVNTVRPYNRINGVDNVRHKEPRYHGESRNISSSPMPGQWNEKGEGGDESDWRKFGMHDWRSGSKSAIAL